MICRADLGCFTEISCLPDGEMGPLSPLSFMQDVGQHTLTGRMVKSLLEEALNVLPLGLMLSRVISGQDKASQVFHLL